MDAESLLADGEKILLQDGRNSFTDRRVLTVSRNSFTEVPYEHISSIEFVKNFPIAPIILCALVLIVGAYIWNSDTALIRQLGIDPNLWLTLVIVVAIILVGIGAVLTRRDLTLRTTSGHEYSLRLRDRKTVEEFLSKRGEEITRKWQK